MGAPGGPALGSTGAEARLLFALCPPLCGSSSPLERAASGTGAVGDEDEAFCQLAEEVEHWDDVLTLAALHALTPLLGRRVAATGVTLPPSVAQLLRARCDENALRNMALTRHLVAALELLDASEIPAIPIKGPVLALSAYGDLSLRQFTDLDVVVARRDRTRAQAALERGGYRPLTPLPADAETVLAASDYHRPYVNDSLGVVLELHWGLARRGLGRSLDDAWVWRNSRPVSMIGRSVHALSWEALVVYLCIHGSKHGWLRLGWLYDLAMALRAAAAAREGEPNVDWAVVHGLAEAAGARRMLALGLELVQHLLRERPPERAATALHASGGAVVADLEARVSASLFAPRSASARDALAFQWLVRDRFRDRIAYCAHIATAPHLADVTAAALPALWRPLYRVLRPARLARKYASHLARRGTR